MSEEDILYSIPVKVVKSDMTFKCTIPKEIAKRLQLTGDDRLIWILRKNNSVYIRKDDL